MAYEKTEWVGGENKYNITDQAGNIIHSNIKLEYAGAEATPVSAGNMNKIEQGIFDLNNADFIGFVTATAIKTWVVPSGVTKIRIFACAAGAGIKAGEYLIGQEYTVTPGQTITVVVGTGNTIISGGGLSTITLIAGNISTSLGANVLGLITGFAGGSANGAGGAGGAFGAGGGGGGYNNAGGPGGGCNGFPGGPGGTSSGGPGSNGAKFFNALLARLLKILPDLFTTGGGGAGSVNSLKTGGGGAGGYGAGAGAPSSSGTVWESFIGGTSGSGNPGGASGAYGTPSPGMVLFAYNY